MAEQTYTVVRTATIDAPPAVVYAQIADFHRWPAWSPWEEIDPAMKRTYSGPESGEGAAYGWDGNRKAGQGSMTIVSAQAPSQVVIDLRFMKPFKAQNECRFDIEPDGSGSRVVWTMTGKRTFATRLIEIFRSMDAFMGPDFERGLTKLKQAVRT